TIKLILQQLPDARFLVPLASRETRAIFEQAIFDADAHELPMSLLFGHAHDAITAADAVLVASGTATLECALLKRPMVITYRLPKLTWWMMKRKSYLPYFGLPNILCGRFVVPELIQDDALPENLAQALLNQYHDKDYVEALEQTFTELHHTLRQGTAQKAASAVLQYLPAA
ncbi:MAG: lipid-A-disaccharide synthase, partial [Gallionella sp.]|nr:lipid-A-disaccharide synthase [Gallionella sp.]